MLKVWVWKKKPCEIKPWRFSVSKYSEYICATFPDTRSENDYFGAPGETLWPVYFAIPVRRWSEGGMLMEVTDKDKEEKWGYNEREQEGGIEDEEKEDSKIQWWEKIWYSGKIQKVEWDCEEEEKWRQGGENKYQK